LHVLALDEQALGGQEFYGKALERTLVGS